MNTQDKIQELELIDHFSRLIHVARAAVNMASSYADLEADYTGRWRNTYESMSQAHQLAAVCEVRDLLNAISLGNAAAVEASRNENGLPFTRAAHAAGITFELIEP